MVKKGDGGEEVDKRGRRSLGERLREKFHTTVYGSNVPKVESELEKLVAAEKKELEES